ncbi:MAG TPA: sugar transferase, partial [Gaiellaceae bacterium]|nr:sugar transferase [Gaiellaceae bacterium]
REDQTWADRFAYDAWYLEHWSLWLDARILLRTVGQLFRPEPVPVVDPLIVERAQRGAAEEREP